jgi:hypothetical protein
MTFDTIVPALWMPSTCVADIPGVPGAGRLMNRAVPWSLILPKAEVAPGEAILTVVRTEDQQALRLR